MESSEPESDSNPGPLGEIEYMGTLYHLHQVVFMSKSAHEVGGKRMDMELHVRGKPQASNAAGPNRNPQVTYAQNDLVFVVFFKKSNPNVDYVELENAGFGTGMLK
jgi:hypothetical protein